MEGNPQRGSRNYRPLLNFPTGQAASLAEQSLGLPLERPESINCFEFVFDSQSEWKDSYKLAQIVRQFRLVSI